MIVSHVDVRSFNAQGSPLVIEENVEIVDLVAQEHIGACVPPRRYASNIVLVSSIHETSSCREEERHDDEIVFTHEPSRCSLEERCDALMEDVA